MIAVILKLKLTERDLEHRGTLFKVVNYNQTPLKPDNE